MTSRAQYGKSGAKRKILLLNHLIHRCRASVRLADFRATVQKGEASPAARFDGAAGIFSTISKLPQYLPLLQQILTAAAAPCGGGVHRTVQIGFHLPLTRM